MSGGFLKKYSKIIMAFVGSLLMITFLLNQFSKGGGHDQSETSAGTLAGKDVTNGEISDVGQDLVIVQALVRQCFAERSLNFQSELWHAQSDLSSIWEGEKGARELQFYLLLAEARKYGLVVSQDALENSPAPIDAAIADAGMSDESLKTFDSDLKIYPNRVRRAVADFIAVARLKALADGTLAVSIPELQHLAVDTGAEMQVRYVLLDTSGADHLMWTPTPEDMAKQFADYKDVLTPEPEQTPTEIDGHHYPFGYKYPDQIKLEVLTFDWQQVRDSLKPTTDDYLEARKRYTADPLEYSSKEPDTMPATAPATSAPATEAVPTTQPFESVSAKIIKQILDERANAKVKDMTDAASAALKAAWDKFQNLEDASGYYSVPKEKWPSYETIAADIQKQFGVRPKQEIFGKDWLNAKSLTTQLQDGIGSSGLVLPGSSGREMPQVLFTDLAMNVRELQAHPQGLIAAMHLQVGVDGPVLTDPKHNAYIYRVTEAAPSHAPANLDEVRAAVVHDLRRVELQTENLKYGAQLADEVGRLGMDAVALSHKLSAHLTPVFTRQTLGEKNPYTKVAGPPQPTVVEPLGVVPEFTEAAFDLMTHAMSSQNGSEATQPAASQAAAAPAGTAPAVGSVATGAAGTTQQSHSAVKPMFQASVVSSDSRLQTFVLELRHFTPANTLDFQSNRVGLRKTDLLGQTSAFQPQWYGLEALAARLKFVSAQPLAQKETGARATFRLERGSKADTDAEMARYNGRVAQPAVGVRHFGTTAIRLA